MQAKRDLSLKELIPVLLENKIKILAAITDPAAIKRVDSNEYTGFSIGYTFDNDQGEVKNKQILEVSICKNPFFDDCRIHIAASKDSDVASVSVGNKSDITVVSSTYSPLIEAVTTPSPLHEVKNNPLHEATAASQVNEKKEEKTSYKDNILDIILQLVSSKKPLPMASPAANPSQPLPTTPNTAAPNQQPAATQQPPATQQPQQPAGQPAATQQPAQQPAQPPSGQQQQQPAQPPPAEDLRSLAEKYDLILNQQSRKGK